jgi:hypothetical protein
MDDGAPGAGTVRAQEQSTPNPTVATAASTYQETGTNVYTICRAI